MAPRKKAASSSSASARKPNQSQCRQPSKFGIQHFFERHSQSQAAASSSPKNPSSNPIPTHSTPPAVHPQQGAITTASRNDDEASSQISPEFCKSAAPKRFKFSPGMLIKQSQDDGGDEITWKVSPVNERLRSITDKQLSGISRMFYDALRPCAASSLHPCSQKQKSCLDGKLEKCLSASALMESDKTLASSRKPLASIQEKETSSCHGRSMDGLQSPFRTPPSVSYGHNEPIGGVAYNEVSDELGSQQHRKALLELLDQVEDAIAEEAFPGDTMVCKSHDANGSAMNVETDTSQCTSLDTVSDKVDGSSSDETFLVLEVTEKHASTNSLHTVKILRILKEQAGQERALHLCDEWLYTPIVPGDTINVIGEFNDQGICVVDHNNNLLVLHPDILLSGTRVASSFNCSRRAALDERLKCTEHSMSALLGTLLHQIFQAALLKELPTHHFLEEYARIVVQKNIESLYACGADEQNTYSTLIEAVPRILNWLRCFKDTKDEKAASVDFGHNEQKSVSISEVIDIEEMAWAPRYGLKGMIDASIRVKTNTGSGCQNENIMPLEFKSGKGTTGQSAMEHCAQVILYTLLMSERYLKKDIDSGLLYYLQTDQTRGIKVQRSDLVGLIMRRNELATDILKASTAQILPPMLQNLSLCKDCRHLSTCTLYHKAHGGNTDSSGLGNLFESLVGHLTRAHSDFLKHWERLIDLEAKTSQMAKKEILRSHSSIGEHSNNRLSSIVLDTGGCESSINGRFIYHFVHQKLACSGHDMLRGEKLDVLEHGVRKTDCTLRCGDYVILSTESGRIAVASGVISNIDQVRVSVSTTRRLRLPGTDPSIGLEALTQVVWRLDKDEISSSYSIMRYNIIQLFLQSPQSLHLRKMIVDLEAPRFDSGRIFSQDPAVSYVRLEKNLNDDQRRAIHKILSAKDYTLILGMPGTGKTSTMVHAVKALLRRGSSILLTSYTNSAIDNLLIKLKAQGIDFIRIGRHEAVHDDIRGHCFSALEVQTVDKIKQVMENIRVVGVTCLGINHPLLANKRFDICIMDEAGQITLPVSLGPLMLASTFVLVGDHYQLPPLVQSAEARENGMGVSLFCRLSEAHPQAISALQCQYRMCSGIMELSNVLIYGNRLRCGSSEIANAKLKLYGGESSALWLKEVLDPNKPVVFTNTDLLPAQETRERKTVKNSFEAYIVSEITRELMKKGIGSDEIGVITPYNSQADLIRHVLGASVEIHTIDKYQGRDKDCILVSFVRSTENPRACSSSLLGDWHRINVVLTRAKKKLIMVGSCKTLSKVPLLKLLIEKVDEQGGLVYVSNKDMCHIRDLKKCSQTSVE